MAEPISSTTATVALAGITLLSLFPGVDASVVLGAFAGSVVFVVSSEDINALRKAALGVVSFIGGCLGAKLAINLIGFITPTNLEINNGIGALIAAALCVKTLFWIIKQDLFSFISQVRGGGK
jgi:hypothetical protein